MFSRLFRLSLRPNASVVEVLNSSQAAWDLSLRWNLTELEMLEWSNLSNLLSPIALRLVDDSLLGLLITLTFILSNSNP